MQTNVVNFISLLLLLGFDCCCHRSLWQYIVRISRGTANWNCIYAVFCIRSVQKRKKEWMIEESVEHPKKFQNWCVWAVWAYTDVLCVAERNVNLKFPYVFTSSSLDSSLHTNFAFVYMIFKPALRMYACVSVWLYIVTKLWFHGTKNQNRIKYLEKYKFYGRNFYFGLQFLTTCLIN